jgi:hypothetical protein
MRSLGLVVLLMVAACSQPAPSAATAKASPSATPAATPGASVCQLPVWWSADQDIHAGFVSVPDGAFTDVGILPLLRPTSNSLSSLEFYGAVYLRTSKSWLKVNRDLVSPDGTQIAFWESDTSTDYSEIRVINVASHDERVIYRGTTMYIPIAFRPDGIYLVHAIRLRQGSFEKLYRLDPAGGTPQLVPGSDRHMYQYGWVLIADGAAWGIDYLAQGNDFKYSVIRLDLATATATSWIEGQPKIVWPEGVDGEHRLYAAPYDGPLFRVDSPGHAVELVAPEGSQFAGGIGVPSPVVDSMGVWFSGRASVWLYAVGHDAKKFEIAAKASVWPAGPCT